MNFHPRKPLDTYVIFDTEDRFHASVCLGMDEARDILTNFPASSSIHVHQITEGYPALDVTADFIADEDDMTDIERRADREASRADRLIRERKEMV